MRLCNHARGWASAARSALLGSTLLGLAGAAFASTSTLYSPSVTFTSPGVKNVTLQVCNRSGCNTVTKFITVLDPAPAVVSATASPLTVEVGQLVRLSGDGTGLPPRTFKWQILRGLSVVSEINAATGFWDTRGVPLGVYSAVFSVSNSLGTAQSLPQLLLVVPKQGTRFYTLPPCRILDTRSGLPLTSLDSPRIVQMTGGPCGVPANARAVAANVTAVSPSVGGFITIFPGNYPQPATSTINFAAHRTLANSAVLPLATDGTGTLAILPALPAGSSVHLLIDVSGYFAVPLIP